MTLPHLTVTWPAKARCESPRCGEHANAQPVKSCSLLYVGVNTPLLYTLQLYVTHVQSLFVLGAFSHTQGDPMREGYQREAGQGSM